MGKFRGVVLGVTIGALMFGLTGCISAPPEEVGSVPVSVEATETGSGSASEGTTATTTTTEPVETATVPETEETYKVVVKPASGEFTPSEEVQKVMTGDASTLGFNYIYAMSDDEQAVAEAIKAGHFYVGAAEDGPKIQIKAKNLMMGDHMSMAQEKNLKVEVTGLKSGSVVKLINKEGIVEEKKVMGDKYSTRITVDQEGFCFVEVWGGDGKLVALTNPMYVTP